MYILHIAWKFTSYNYYSNLKVHHYWIERCLEQLGRVINCVAVEYYELQRLKYCNTYAMIAVILQ